MPSLLRRVLSRLKARFAPASAGYAIVSAEAVAGVAQDGWRDPSVAAQQDAAYQGLLAEMRAGRPREDFVVAAEALRRTELAAPRLLEVGCGSGYYSEILPTLLGQDLAYSGLDYSPAMVELARSRFPSRAFVVGDATALPFEDEAFDVVMNGVALMHILDWKVAIAESVRVSRSWCLFHTVPVAPTRETTILRKEAYGRPTIEIVFNEAELLAAFAAAGLEVVWSADSIPYNLEGVLGEKTGTRSYLCRKPC